MARASIIARSLKSGAVLYVRFSHQRLERFVSIGIPVKLKDWDKKRQRMRSGALAARDVNPRLAEIANQAEAAIQSTYAASGAVTAIKIAQRFRESIEGVKRSEDLLTYADDFLQQQEDRGKIGTFRAYRTSVRKLRDFLAKSRRRTLPFDELTPAMLRRFETYLVEIGNKTNTVHKALSCIRTIYYQAIRDGLASQDSNPFFHMKLRRAKAKKERLTIEQIRAIEQLELEGLTARVRDYWLFAFYTGGMRFSDVATLRPEHIHGGRIAYRMKKTAQDTSIVLLDQAKAILDRYPPRPRSPWVFPILDGERTRSANEMHNAIGKKNALINKYLKKIAAAAGVDVSLSFHMARHSLADYLRSQGWSVYDISKMLNHASVSITEAYLAGFDADDLDEKMRGTF